MEQIGNIWQGRGERGGMNAPAKIGKYPSKPALRRAVEQARELGLDVAGFEIAPGGVIRVLDRAAFPAPAAPENAFDKWVAQQDENSERPARRP